MTVRAGASVLRKSFQIGVLLIALAWPVTSRADEKIIFDPFPSGFGSKLVGQAWSQNPDYKDYFKTFTMVPDYMMGLADVNGDGQAEIFARHSDPELGFCDFPSGTACVMHVYVYTKGKTVEIGKFKAGEPVIVLDSKTKNINDLQIVGSDNKKHVYVWDGKRYAPK